MTARVILPAGATRNDWLDARRDGVGGSEVGAILGASPWSTPTDVWASKVHGDQAEENDAMRVGSALEAGVLALGLANLADEHGGDWWAEGDLPALLAHPYHDVIRYSPDGIAHGPRESVLLEAKVTSSRYDDPPAHWVAQVQWGLLVTGLPWAQITAVTGSRATHWRIDPDPEWQNEAANYALRWWADYVDTGNPPPPVTLADAARWWRPDPDAGTWAPYVTDADSLAAAHEALAYAKDRVAEAEKAYKAELLACLVRSGGSQTWDVDGQKVTVRLSSRDTLDSRALRKTHPRIARRYTRTSTPTITATWPRRKDHA